jgi:hypothetical protein
MKIDARISCEAFINLNKKLFKLDRIKVVIICQRSPYKRDTYEIAVAREGRWDDFFNCSGIQFPDRKQ